jgi:hypothetical protein
MYRMYLGVYIVHTVPLYNAIGIRRHSLPVPFCIPISIPEALVPFMV